MGKIQFNWEPAEQGANVLQTFIELAKGEAEFQSQFFVVVIFNKVGVLFVRTLDGTRVEKDSKTMVEKDSKY